MSRAPAALKAAFLLLVIIACGVIGMQALQAAQLRERLPVNTRLGGPIGLPATTGGAFDLAAQRGKVVVLTFGYTSCPNICPTNLARLARMLKQLGPDADRVKVLFISFDPERDTLAQLKPYLGYFDPRIIGATGTPTQIAAVAQRYGAVYLREDDSGGYNYDHSDYIYLLDTQGRVRTLYGSQGSSDDMAADARALLSARPNFFD